MFCRLFYFVCIYVFVILLGLGQPLSAQVAELNHALNEIKNVVALQNKDAEPQKPSVSVVKFNGHQLFTIAAETDGKVQKRVELIKVQLGTILTSIEEQKVKDLTALKMRLRGTSIVTKKNTHILDITDDDLQYHSQDINLLSKKFINILDNTIEQAYLEHTDKHYKKQRNIKATIYFILAIILSICLVRYRVILAPDSLQFKLLGLWLFTLGAILVLYPQTRFVQQLWSVPVVQIICALFIILWCTLITLKVVRYLIVKYFGRKTNRSWSATERKNNRINTLERLTLYGANLAVIFIAILVFFAYINLDLQAVLTGAGFVGLALGFLAQDIIKDYVNGLIIFLEDQYALGDVVVIDDFRGEVIDFSLRLTSLRNMEGSLITIPNREISAVQNLTNSFSQVDYRIDVDYSTDLEYALSILNEVAQGLYEDYERYMTDKPDLLGVDEFKDSAIALRILLKTLPSKQWEMKREFNLRIKKAFDESNISIPFPQRVVHYANAEKKTTDETVESSVEK